MRLYIHLYCLNSIYLYPYFLKSGSTITNYGLFAKIDKKESRTINCCTCRKRGYLLLYTSYTRESAVNNDTRSAWTNRHYPWQGWGCDKADFTCRGRKREPRAWRQCLRPLRWDTGRWNTVRLQSWWRRTFQVWSWERWETCGLRPLNLFIQLVSFSVFEVVWINIR